MTSSSHPHTRWNFILFYLDYALFGAAISFMGSATVVPDFVRRLTTSETLIGLSASLYSVSWLLPQLLLAQFISRGTRRKPYMFWTVVPFRLMMVVLALGIALVNPQDHTAILVIFLTCYVIFALGDGLITLVWADLIGGSIPERWRGVLFSSGQVTVAVTTLGTRAIIDHMLGPSGPTFPQNYAQMFGIAAALFLVAGVLLMLLVETPSAQPKKPGPAMNQYVPYLSNVLRTDHDFQRFVFTRMLIDMTMLCAPFYVIFGADYLKLPSATLIGDSVLLATAGSATGAILMGWLSHNSGSRAVIRLGGLASCLHPILGLLSFSLGQPALYGALFLLGFVTSAITPGYFDWILTHAPADHRPIYIGLTNTIAAASNLAPFFGGVLLSLTASSYQTLFACALVCGLVGTLSTRFLSEPRQRNRAAQAG